MFTKPQSTIDVVSSLSRKKLTNRSRFFSSNLCAIDQFFKA